MKNMSETRKKSPLRTPTRTSSAPLPSSSNRPPPTKSAPASPAPPPPKQVLVHSEGVQTQPLTHTLGVQSSPPYNFTIQPSAITAQPTIQDAVKVQEPVDKPANKTTGVQYMSPTKDTAAQYSIPDVTETSDLISDASFGTPIMFMSKNKSKKALSGAYGREAYGKRERTSPDYTKIDSSFMLPRGDVQARIQEWVRSEVLTRLLVRQREENVKIRMEEEEEQQVEVEVAVPPSHVEEFAKEVLEEVVYEVVDRETVKVWKEAEAEMRREEWERRVLEGVKGEGREVLEAVKKIVEEERMERMKRDEEERIKAREREAEERGRREGMMSVGRVGGVVGAGDLGRVEDKLGKVEERLVNVLKEERREEEDRRRKEEEERRRREEERKVEMERERRQKEEEERLRIEKEAVEKGKKELEKQKKEVEADLERKRREMEDRAKADQERLLMELRSEEEARMRMRKEEQEHREEMEKHEEEKAAVRITQSVAVQAQLDPSITEPATIGSSESSSVGITTLSTMLSEGEVVTHFFSEGEVLTGLGDRPLFNMLRRHDDATSAGDADLSAEPVVQQPSRIQAGQSKDTGKKGNMRKDDGKIGNTSKDIDKKGNVSAEAETSSASKSGTGTSSGEVTSLGEMSKVEILGELVSEGEISVSERHVATSSNKKTRVTHSRDKKTEVDIETDESVSIQSVKVAVTRKGKEPAIAKPAPKVASVTVKPAEKLVDYRETADSQSSDGSNIEKEKTSASVTPALPFFEEKRLGSVSFDGRAEKLESLHESLHGVSAESTQSGTEQSPLREAKSTIPILKVTTSSPHSSYVTPAVPPSVPPKSPSLPLQDIKSSRLSSSEEPHVVIVTSDDDLIPQQNELSALHTSDLVSSYSSLSGGYKGGDVLKSIRDATDRVVQEGIKFRESLDEDDFFGEVEKKGEDIDPLSGLLGRSKSNFGSKVC
ncbi:hypothetical protein BC829DRAFT_291473 [Chytridium lagenaria]|nr:hypothetical protein BC829DRAFT_291473 [Chytridium lagenaria]